MTFAGASAGNANVLNLVSEVLIGGYSSREYHLISLIRQASVKDSFRPSFPLTFEMSAAATTSRSARTPKSPWSSHSQSRAPKATIVLPARTSASIGQGPPPTLTPSNHPGSPTQQNISARASSPSYFGLAVQDDIDNPINSDAGGYAKKNWRSPSSSRLSKAPEHVQSTSHETTPSLVAFQRQSETKVFQLDMGSSITSACSPRPTNPRSSSTFDDTSSLKSPKHITSDVAIEGSHQATAMELDVKSPLKRGLSSGVSEESQFGLPRRESPATLPTLSNLGTSRQLSHIDDRHPRLSLPNHRVSDSTTSQDVNFLGRSNTLPSELTGGQPNLLSPQDFVSLMDHVRGDNLLLLDLRVSPQFAQSRIHGALNLCIPTTLLKRPSFNVQKLLETFTVDAERRKFSGWKEMHYIVMYDANSAKLKDASSAVNTIKKFTSEGWKGVAYIVCGGYAEINKAFPNMVESAGTNSPNQQGQKPLALNGSGIIPVAGGFSMPAQKSVANPFFGNIRQNMDLIGGVGQIPIKHPDHLSHKSFKLLPMWLQRAAEEVDKGKAVSNNFLRIEKDEQERMQSALSTDVIYGTPGPALKSGFQVAGIEKGTKNRYKDILPFDHTRVKIRDLTTSSCDYINASHIKAEWSNRHYIATQAPMPSTFGVRIMSDDSLSQC